MKYKGIVYKCKFNGTYSRNNLIKIKDRAYAINLDKFKSKGTHWLASYENNLIYFDSW